MTASEHAEEASSCAVPAPPTNHEPREVPRGREANHLERVIEARAALVGALYLRCQAVCAGRLEHQARRRGRARRDDLPRRRVRFALGGNCEPGQAIYGLILE